MMDTNDTMEFLSDYENEWYRPYEEHVATYSTEKIRECIGYVGNDPEFHASPMEIPVMMVKGDERACIVSPRIG